MFKRGERKGLSGVITTVLIILLAIVSISFIAYFTFPLIKESNLDRPDNVPSFEFVDDSVKINWGNPLDASTLEFNLVRTANTQNWKVVGFLVFISGDSKEFKDEKVQESDLFQGDTKNFIYNFKDITFNGALLEGVEKISVRPIFQEKEGTKKIVSKIPYESRTNLLFGTKCKEVSHCVKPGENQACWSCNLALGGVCKTVSGNPPCSISSGVLGFCLLGRCNLLGSPVTIPSSLLSPGGGGGGNNGGEGIIDTKTCDKDSMCTSPINITDGNNITKIITPTSESGTCVYCDNDNGVCLAKINDESCGDNRICNSKAKCIINCTKPGSELELFRANFDQGDYDGVVTRLPMGGVVIQDTIPLVYTQDRFNISNKSIKFGYGSTNTDLWYAITNRVDMTKIYSINGLSYSFWIKRNNTGVVEGLFSYSNDYLGSVSEGNGLTLSIGTPSSQDNKLHLTNNVYGSLASYTFDAVSDETIGTNWTHVVITIKSSTTKNVEVKFYIDGLNKGNYNKNIIDSNNFQAIFSTPYFHIGRLKLPLSKKVGNLANKNLDNGNEFTPLSIEFVPLAGGGGTVNPPAQPVWDFSGDMDDFVVYNKVLSECEVYKIYN